jgi:hypothetical protein
MALTNFVRLSLMKAAHAVMSSAAYSNPGVTSVYQAVTARWKNASNMHNPLMTKGRESSLNSDTVE